MIDAGPFAAWLASTREAIRGEHDADVPCDGCTACCEASQFIHIDPDESDTLAHVPAALRFPAPMQPAGHWLLGHDQHGRCPMLVDGACSIYAHRPRACRTYDCRVYAAADVVPDHQVAVAVRVRSWQFTFPSRGDRQAADAVVARAERLRHDPDGPRHPTAIAVAAVMTAESGDTAVR